MANNIKKLPFPHWLVNTQYSLTLFKNGIGENGEPVIHSNKEGKCIFSEKSKRVIDAEGKQIQLVGKVVIEGDIEPSLKIIGDGSITINDKTYEIYSSFRPRNPDGSIYCTEFELK